MFEKIWFLGVFIIFSNSVIAAHSSTSPITVQSQGTIEVAFSPNNGATEAIIRSIDEAKTSIFVEAYSFTSIKIEQALLAAKNRGVKINVILDKSQVIHKYSSASFFFKLGFPLHIDNKHAIFHNKVMIIDEDTLITGSFNFTQAAEKNNAENLLIIRHNPKLAAVYINEFNYNWNNSLGYEEYIDIYNPNTVSSSKK